MSPVRAVVVGLGNDYRRDDGVGPATVAALAGHRLPGVRLVTVDGDPARLLAAFDGVPLTVIVDAVRCAPAMPGQVHRLLIGDLPGPGRATSSHGLGLGAAVELGRVLGRLPDRLVVFGVEIADQATGFGLTPAVAAAVPELVRAITAEVNTP